MSKVLQVLAAASLAFAATAARAADPAQLDCPLTSLTGEQRRALDDYIAEQGATEDPRFLAYDRAVNQCAARFNWSPRARGGAFGFGFASAVERHMRRLITERGVDLRPLEEAIMADRALIAAEMGSEAQRQALTAFLSRNIVLVTQLTATRPADDQLSAWLGAFISTRAIRDSAREAFRAN